MSVFENYVWGRKNFFLKVVSEPIAFLDVQVNHIEVGHINNKVLSKTVQRYEVFLVSQAVSVSFFLFLLQI